MLDVNENGRVSGFREKPVIPLSISLGAYAMSRALLGDCPLDFDPDRSFHRQTTSAASGRPARSRDICITLPSSARKDILTLSRRLDQLFARTSATGMRKSG